MCWALTWLNIITFNPHNLRHRSHYYSPSTCERKLRHREIKSLVEGHAARRRRTQSSNPLLAGPCDYSAAPLLSPCLSHKKETASWLHCSILAPGIMWHPLCAQLFVDEVTKRRMEWWVSRTSQKKELELGVESDCKTLLADKKYETFNLESGLYP